MLCFQTWDDTGWQGKRIPPLHDFIVNSKKTHFIPQTSQKLCKSLQLENRPFCPAAVIAASEGAEQDEPLSISSTLDRSFAQLIVSGTAAPENALTMMLPAAEG